MISCCCSSLGSEKKKFTLAAIELLKFAPCNKIRTFHLGIEPTLQCAELLPAARDSRMIL
jgi:hypothetical protein